jgi:hypothetical protein
MKMTEQEKPPWEKEIFVRHRWGQHGEEKAAEEHARLKTLWDAAQPLEKGADEILKQIASLEICNWDLENSIKKLCEAIGKNDASGLRIGHLRSVTDERWKRIWSYYLTLRNWLPSHGTSGYKTLLKECDAGGVIEEHINVMLGVRTELKELYVERFCRCLEFWLGAFWKPDAPNRAHKAAVEALETEIRKQEPESKILAAMHQEGDGRLEPCSHKAFRRYDIIVSSIGAGEWRGAMPMRGTDGFERAEILEKHLSRIDEWTQHEESGEMKRDELSMEINSLLGEPDGAKKFFASFLVSILRAQGLGAVKRAESRKQA